jgi:autoinducer 2 (AI-2) kinase
MALDAGGGSGRCLVLEAVGGTVHTAKRDWVHPPAPNTSGLGYDLDVADIWRKLGEAAREAMELAGAKPEEVLAVAATSMRNTTVLLDSRGNVLMGTPNQDARAAFEAIMLGAERGKAIHEIGGHWPSPIFTGSRLLWAKANAPEMLDRTDTVLSLSEWVGLRLGGGAFAEKSQAGETMLFDLATRDWSRDLISSLGFDESLFPETVDAGTVIGALSDEAALNLGLMPGTAVVAGGADTQCALLGAAAVDAGEICVISGTTLPIQMVTGSLVLDEEGRLWSGLHVVPGLYALESNGLTAGFVLEWFSRILYSGCDDPVKVLFGEAARSEPGCGGVYSSFGASVFDARSIGIPVGNLTMSHMVTSDSSACSCHISRALVEGIAYSTRANIQQILDAAGAEVREIKVAGGMTKSPLWNQMLSDVIGKPVRVPATPEVSALGAAICAGVGAGVFPDLEEGAKSLAKAQTEYTPGESSPKYQALFAGWKEAHEMRGPADQHVSGLLTVAMLERPQAEKAVAPSFRPRVLVTASMDDAALEQLRLLGELEYAPWRDSLRVYDGGADLVGLLEGSQVFVTEMDVVDFEVIRDARALRAIFSCRGNTVNIDVESATAFGIPVINTPGRNADAVADLTVAMMIMLARKLAGAARFLKEGDIEAGDLSKMGEAYIKYQGRELWRKTVGIVGLGSVGSRVARRLVPFGAKVIFCDPSVSSSDGAVLNARKVGFDELLSLSDFVTLHAATSEDNRRLMDREAFAMMKEGVFINTARASLVDDDALADALESGHLAGAALDVFPVEPPASDDRIVSRKNVIATPHIGGNTREIAAHQGAIVVEQLRTLLAGGTPDHIINPEVMEGFNWSGPRPVPPAGELERLAGGPRPSMTS